MSLDEFHPGFESWKHAYNYWNVALEKDNKILDGLFRKLKNTKQQGGLM